MAEFFIQNEDLAGLKGKVVIVTGGSSGIGLAAVELLLSLGASVVDADLQPPKESPPAPLAGSGASFTFHRTDVAHWPDLVALFKATTQRHGRVDHVFANAGISYRADYFSIELDANGDLKEPTGAAYDVNLRGVVNTTTLAVYHMRQQDPPGGSVVISGSVSGIQRFRGVDYCKSFATTKHAVLGFMRSMTQSLTSKSHSPCWPPLPIRVNAIAPSWTQTGVVPVAVMRQVGNAAPQLPDAPARAAALLMADGSRRGHLVHVSHGRYREIDEGVLLPAFEGIPRGTGDDGGEEPPEDEVLGKMVEAMGGTYKDAV